MGIFDGLEKFGIKNIDSDSLYAEQTPKKAANASDKSAKEEKEFDERDAVFVKKLECPICDSEINHITVKSGKSKLVRTDRDLRPVFEGFEPIKYEPVLCECCGYCVMGKYLSPLAPSQKKAVRETIGMSYTGKAHKGDLVSYEEAMEKITLALASAMVKRAKASEKAYICLKGGWLCRSFRESLNPDDEEYEIACEELMKKEKEFLDNAYEGFSQARSTEGYPMAGMDEITIDYLIAVMAADRGKYDVASRMIASILQSVSAPTRIKDKARDLKEEVVAKIKENKA